MANTHKPLHARAHITALKENTLLAEVIFFKHALWSVGIASPCLFLLAASWSFPGLKTLFLIYSYCLALAEEQRPHG